MSSDRRADLEYHFRNQQQFAMGYSPLYERLFGILADWLAAGESEPAAEWLVGASAGRPSFDVTLLLAAALHRDVLAGEAAARQLARFYPTAAVWSPLPGGEREVLAVGVQSPELEEALRQAILHRRSALADFIQRANVQTNETGRGLVWLLPVACLRWPAVHLVELGASAGLNLVADQRAYRVVDAAGPFTTLLALGEGEAQFSVFARGPADIPPLSCCPTILSRTGGDMYPIHLRTPADELNLAAFVWGDQALRLARLKEGIAALRRVEATTAPVTLFPMRLPDDLPRFLERDLPSPSAPLILFNTTVSMYLPDRGRGMVEMIDRWATRMTYPVLWLQWEPWWDGPPPPEKEWLAWTADYWPNDGRATRLHYHLAWVHPHGTALEWAGGWADFLRITE